MIIGTSHISLTSCNLDKDIRSFEERGFRLRFQEKEIQNSEEKKPFLNRFELLHSLAVLAGDSGMDLELVQHHETADGRINESPVVRFEGSSVHMIEFQVARLEQSADFWETFMGFGIAQSESGQIIMEKKAMFPNWASKICLVENHQATKKPKLDSEGATSFAFLTTGLDKDLERASDEFSLFCSKPFEMNVNGRELRIAMLEGPSNEIIELIQIKHET